MDIKKTGQMELYGQLQVERPENRVGTHSGAAKGTVAPQTDTVKVSDEAILRTEAYRTAMNSGDIRQDKVNALKDQLANGTYEVNPHRIAAHMLNEEATLIP